MMMQLDFTQWLVLLDRYVREMTGASLADLPDYPTRDAYDEGLSASEVAEDLYRRGWF